MLHPVPGKLFVIATPLGNLDDISPRAVQTLRQVDLILCEDTRRSARLLDRYDIEKPKLSYHRFNERERLQQILRELHAGRDIALVSDGGTPAISDPGFLLVRALLDAGLEVCPIPGPSAVATLLSVSGLPADRYLFEGFLPHRQGERRRRLRQLRPAAHTTVLFEAPHRIADTLRDIEEIFGKRQLVLGRELTKRYETILVGSAAEIAARLGDEVKGEITIAIAGALPGDRADEGDQRAERVRESWRRALGEADGDSRAALRSAAKALGMKRPELYRLLAELGEDPDGGSR
jgi:16S rRNA (cytidine1402-2'-O)-methyltransferase